VLRQLFVFLSERRALQEMVTRNGLVRRAALRFVAGEALEEACAVAAELNRRGIQVTLDLLGERVTNPEEARAAAEQYRTIVEEIQRQRLDADIAIKLTQLGLDLSEDLVWENLTSICGEARARANFVWIDMEASRYVEPTLTLYRRLREGGYGPDDVGVAIQAYLYRSAQDVEDLIALRARVRLVKGAYAEPATVAYPRKADVDRAYVRLMERLLQDGYRPAIATHDDRILAHVKAFSQRQGIPLDRFEFQMLYGVRRDLQTQIVEEGYRLRVYVPFGTQWYPYFMRRLGERPANVGFLLRSLLRERGGFLTGSGVQ
jgi:proline dehydrogenase